MVRSWTSYLPILFFPAFPNLSTFSYLAFPPPPPYSQRSTFRPDHASADIKALLIRAKQLRGQGENWSKIYAERAFRTQARSFLPTPPPFSLIRWYAVQYQL